MGRAGVIGGAAVLSGAALITRTGANGAPLAHRRAWIALALVAGAGLVAATIGLTIVGQQLASLAVDRFGLLRLPRRHLTTQRKVGVVLVLAGVALVQAI